MADEVIQLEDGWSQIKRDGIDRLLQLLRTRFGEGGQPEFTKKEFMQIYTVCYNMCIQPAPHNWSEHLYQRHHETIRSYLTSEVLPALRKKHGQFLLEELARRWEQHGLMNKWMRRFFMYLDRYYVDFHKLPRLMDSGLSLFADCVFTHVKDDVAQAVIALVQKDRSGEPVDGGLIKRCVDVYVVCGMNTLDLYRNSLEGPLLQATAQYYRAQAAEWVARDTTPDYLARTERVLVDEAIRVENYLHDTSESELLGVMEDELLAQHEMSLIEKDGSGLMFLLQEGRAEDLARMYRLFSRVHGGLKPVAAVVKDFIQTAGLGIVSQRAVGGGGGGGGASGAAASGAGKGGGKTKEVQGNPAFVKALMGLLTRSRALVGEQFAGDSMFQKALKDAFEVFVNRETPGSKYSTTDHLASYCDRVLRGVEKLVEDEVEEALANVVQLFAYIIDKDKFGEIYRNQLARRLLNQTMTSRSAEQSMIGKLKMRCGPQYTSKMEGMMNDLNLASELQKKFDSWRDGDGAAEARAVTLEFSTTILTQGWWPSFKDVKLVIPPQMSGCQTVFQKFYNEVTSNRKLAWCHSQGQALVGARFDKTYDLQLTTLQATCLLAFNGMDGGAADAGGAAGGGGSLSFGDVSQRLNLAEDVAKRVLHSLSCGKVKVLAKSPPGRTIATTDTFSANTAFKNPRRRLKVPMAILEESQTQKRVEDDRRSAIDAAVVRTMKSAKSMAHKDLFAQVLRQLSLFRPDPKLIKRRIEYLIENDYMERDESNPSLYLYVA